MPNYRLLFNHYFTGVSSFSVDWLGSSGLGVGVLANINLYALTKKPIVMPAMTTGAKNLFGALDFIDGSP